MKCSPRVLRADKEPSAYAYEVTDITYPLRVTLVENRFQGLLMYHNFALAVVLARLCRDWTVTSMEYTALSGEVVEIGTGDGLAFGSAKAYRGKAAPAEPQDDLAAAISLLSSKPSAPTHRVGSKQPPRPPAANDGLVTQMNSAGFKCVRHMPKALGGT